MLAFFRKYHKWFSLVVTLFILFFAGSGIILNHRKELSGLDVSRRLLPDNYTYRNWNLAAVKGNVTIRRDSILLYGNIGIWLTDSSFRTFRDWNAGFPDGIDNRKINTLYWSRASGLVAGTLFGLYRMNGTAWEKVALPEEDPRVVKIIATGDSLLVMTRSHLYLADRNSVAGPYREIPLPRGEDDDGKTGLFKTLWVIHSGEIYGLAGKLIVDGVGIVFIILCITGLIYFVAPYRIKNLAKKVRSGNDPQRISRYQKMRSRTVRFNRQSLKWHNVLGSWMIVILLLNTATGMFLRPPLLIPVAYERVAKLKYTELDDPNPWFDRLRDILYDEKLHRFLIPTSEGIYYSDDGFRSELKRFPVQPPVSVMGINVFRVIEPGKYYVGSFSGIFEWEPASGRVIDGITRTEYHETGRQGPPFGAVTVAGMVVTPDSSGLIFDYANGLLTLSGKNPLPGMPENIVRANPISLWNTCLEIHTGRIFEPILGPFYILVVPLVGLATLFILVSGFFAWWLAKKSVRVTRAA